jgi:hypothetical protein
MTAKYTEVEFEQSHPTTHRNVGPAAKASDLPTTIPQPAPRRTPLVEKIFVMAFFGFAWLFRL